MCVGYVVNANLNVISSSKYMFSCNYWTLIFIYDNFGNKKDEIICMWPTSVFFVRKRKVSSQRRVLVNTAFLMFWYRGGTCYSYSFLTYSNINGVFRQLISERRHRWDNSLSIQYQMYNNQLISSKILLSLCYFIRMYK